MHLLGVFGIDQTGRVRMGADCTEAGRTRSDRTGSDFARPEQIKSGGMGPDRSVLERIQAHIINRPKLDQFSGSGWEPTERDRTGPERTGSFWKEAEETKRNGTRPS